MLCNTVCTEDFLGIVNVYSCVIYWPEYIFSFSIFAAVAKPTTTSGISPTGNSPANSTPPLNTHALKTFLKYVFKQNSSYLLDFLILKDMNNVSFDGTIITQCKMLLVFFI